MYKTRKTIEFSTSGINGKPGTDAPSYREMRGRYEQDGSSASAAQDITISLDGDPSNSTGAYSQ